MSYEKKNCYAIQNITKAPIYPIHPYIHCANFQIDQVFYLFLLLALLLSLTAIELPCSKVQFYHLHTI